MAGPAAHLGDELEAALVAADRPQPGRLADDGDRRLPRQGAEIFVEPLAAEAADLLVIGEGDVQRLLQVAGARRQGRRLGEHGGEKPLHVDGAAAVEPARALVELEGRRAPSRAVGRHDVEMAGEHDAAAARGPHRGEEVGALAGLVDDALADDAVSREMRLAIGDDRQVRQPGHRRKGDEVAQQGLAESEVAAGPVAHFINRSRGKSVRVSLPRAVTRIVSLTSMPQPSIHMPRMACSTLPGSST